VGVLFEVINQPFPHRILKAIANTIFQFILSSNGVIMILGFPQWPVSPRKTIYFLCCETLQGMHQRRQSFILKACGEMNMVRHNNDRYQLDSALSVQPFEAVYHNLCRSGVPKYRRPVLRARRDKIPIVQMRKASSAQIPLVSVFAGHTKPSRLEAAPTKRKTTHTYYHLIVPRSCIERKY
jgi:hypothetical protein